MQKYFFIMQKEIYMINRFFYEYQKKVVAISTTVNEVLRSISQFSCSITIDIPVNLSGIYSDIVHGQDKFVLLYFPAKEAGS